MYGFFCSEKDSKIPFDKFVLELTNFELQKTQCFLVQEDVTHLKMAEAKVLTRRNAELDLFKWLQTISASTLLVLFMKPKKSA